MRSLISIPFLFLFTSSIAQISSTASFYFPAKSFFQEKQYHYINQVDTTEKTVWKMKTSISKNGDTLFQTIITNNGNIAELMVEKIQNGNSKIFTYTLFNNNKTALCTVIDSAVYKTNQNREGQIIWSATFHDFNSENLIGISKTRQLESINGNKQIFMDLMKIGVVGSSNPYEYSVLAVYEAGIGLISYKITRPNGQIKDYKLVQVK